MKHSFSGWGRGLSISYLFVADIPDVDRVGEAVVTHVELKPAVVVVFLVGGEFVGICLPLGGKVELGVGEVTDPACCGGGYCSYHVAGLVSLCFKSYSVCMTLKDREVGLHQLD